MRDVDVVVIGGGPAGAVVALGLARLGRSVVVVDRRARGEGKTCGHCLDPRALDALDAVAARDVALSVAEGPLDRLRVVTARGPGLTAPLRGGVVVDRGRLDAALLDAARDAGAEVVREHRATVGGDRGGRTVVNATGAAARSWTARLVVGADGLGSRLARRRGLAPREAGRCYGFATDVACAAPAAPPRGTVLMVAGRLGYAGFVSSSGGRVHVGGLVRGRAGAGVRRDPAGFLRGLVASTLELHGTALADAACAATDYSAIGPMPWRPRAIADDGVALVGDAAGYHEPFTGDGMRWAIASALALVETVAEAGPRVWPAGAAAAYARRRRAAVGGGLRACRVVTRLLEMPFLLDGAARLLAGRPGLAAGVARVVTA